MAQKIVVVGDYGSGKTEFSLNLAMGMAEQTKVRLVDLDIVNPYFRTRDAAELLEKAGVEVVFNQDYRTADLPALSPRIDTVVADSSTVILDVGGDNGSVVLGRYRQPLLRHQASVWLIANCNRPFTSDVAGILQAAERIQEKSGLTITGLINNTNLGRQTEAEHVRNGAAIVTHAARKLAVPVVWHCARPHLLPQLQMEFEDKLFAMELSLFPEDII